MFFTASIALASILALSKVAVNSAPLAVRDVVPQSCTLPLGKGVCTPLNGTNCTNTPGMQSLILNPDASCAAFLLPDCNFDPTHPASEQFEDDSQNLAAKAFQSVQCFEVPGTINGFTEGSPEDVATEAADKAAGIKVLGQDTTTTADADEDADAEEDA